MIQPTTLAVEQPIPQICPYLEGIAIKKANSVALGCIESIVHWFLTVFSCFYPAYSQFYEMKKVDVEEASPDVRSILTSLLDPNQAQERGKAIEDQSTITFFYYLKKQLNGEEFPSEAGTSHERAEAIRIWMADNSALLEPIINLDLSGNMGQLIKILPPEINLLTNLRFLDLSGTGILYLPNNFNPPKLLALYLDRTPIDSLPADFNPPMLTGISLNDSHLASLPEGFNPPILKWIYLKNAPIAVIPEGFNPPGLEEFEIRGTRIESLPPSFDPPSLDWTLPPLPALRAARRQ